MSKYSHPLVQFPKPDGELEGVGVAFSPRPETHHRTGRSPRSSVLGGVPTVGAAEPPFRPSESWSTSNSSSARRSVRSLGTSRASFHRSGRSKAWEAGVFLYFWGYALDRGGGSRPPKDGKETREQTKTHRSGVLAQMTLQKVCKIFDSSVSSE